MFFKSDVRLAHYLLLHLYTNNCHLGSASAVQARAKTPNVPQDSKNYLGMLFPTEHYRIYGYITTTNVKFVLVLNDQSNAKDPEIRNVRIPFSFSPRHIF